MNRPEAGGLRFDGQQEVVKDLIATALSRGIDILLKRMRR